jgi:hypothetical protein
LRRLPSLTEDSPGACAPARQGGCLSYLIAAYGIVIAALTLYGLRIQAQRRAQLRRRPPAREE